MLNKTQEAIWDVLCELDGETVAKAFTDYYGNKLLSSDFGQFLIDEELAAEDLLNTRGR